MPGQETRAAEGTDLSVTFSWTLALPASWEFHLGLGQQTSGKGFLPWGAISLSIPACPGTSLMSLVCPGEIPIAPGHFWQLQKTAKPAAKIMKLFRKIKGKKLNFSFIYLAYRGLASPLCHQGDLKAAAAVGGISESWNGFGGKRS